MFYALGRRQLWLLYAYYLSWNRNTAECLVTCQLTVALVISQQILNEGHVVLASSRIEIIHLVTQAGQTLLEHIGLQFLFLITSTT